MAQCFISILTTFARVDHPALIKAAAVLAAVAPSRHQITDVHLPAAYNATKQTMLERISEAGHFGLASDEWKKRSAFSGSPLNNFLALLLDGGSTFLKIGNISGRVKDATYIKQLTEYTARGSASHRCGVHWGCYGQSFSQPTCSQQLPGADPKLINLGCLEHSLSLLIKDVSKCLPWVGDCYRDAVQFSNAVTTEAIRALFNEAHLHQPDKKCTRSLRTVTQCLGRSSLCYERCLRCRVH
jgi:hypothetical protein